MRYRDLIEQEEDGVYVVEVDVLPDCISQGKTRSEASDNIEEAITGYRRILPVKSIDLNRGERYCLPEFELSKLCATQVRDCNGT